MQPPQAEWVSTEAPARSILLAVCTYSMQIPLSLQEKSEIFSEYSNGPSYNLRGNLQLRYEDADDFHLTWCMKYNRVDL